MKKVGIIMPNYNTPKNLLTEALDSVSRQSIIDDIYLIIIDDGSDYGKYIGLCEVIKKYTFDIKLIRKNKREGPALARQKALDIIDAEYIMFLDSDDEFPNSNSIEISYNNIKKNKLDFMCFAKYIIKNKTRSISRISIENFPNISPLHGFIYKTSFIINHDIKFPNIKYGGCEDSIFNMKCYMNSDKFDCKDDVVYSWKTRDDSNYFFRAKMLEGAVLHIGTMFLSLYLLEDIPNKNRVLKCFCLWNDFLLSDKILEDPISDSILNSYSYIVSMSYKKYFKKYLGNISVKIDNSRTYNYLKCLQKYWNDDNKILISTLNNNVEKFAYTKDIQDFLCKISKVRIGKLNINSLTENIILDW